MALRVAIIRRRYNPFGGAERFIENLGKHLADDNIELSVVSQDWSTAQPGLLPVYGVSVRGTTRYGRLRSFERGVRKVLDQQKFDVVQSHERMTGVDVYRLGDGVHRCWLNRLARERGWGAKLAFACDVYHRAILARESSMARDSHLHYVANSDLVSEELQAAYGVSPTRITRIDNGVDPLFFRPATGVERAAARERLGLPADRTVIGYVGSGFERKGAFLLVRALVGLPKAHLVVCGADKAANALARMVRQLGLGDRVTMTGPQSDVRPVLWSADVFALPSLYDPSPNAVLEAMACGLPVVCTEGVGSARCIRAEGAGLVVNRDPGSLVQVLDHALDPNWQKQAGLAARALALRHDHSKICDQWIHFYQKRGKSR